MQRVALSLALSVLSLGGTGCSRSAPAQARADIRHPRPDLLARPIGVTSHVALDAVPQQDDALVRRFAQARVLARVGSMDGRREEVFGNVEDVAIDGQGLLYVLDARNNEVRVFNRTGHFQYTAASPGRGPGELSQPRALAFGRDGALLVANVMGVEQYAYPAGRRDRIAYRGSRQYPFEPQDMCTLGNDVLIHGVSLDTVPPVHLVRDTTVVNSFGDVYKAPAGIVAFHTKQSRMACVSGPDVVVLAPRSLLGEVHAFTPAGAPRWIAVVDGFHPIDFFQTPRGSRTTIPASGYDRNYSLVEVSPGVLVLQVAGLSLADYEARKEYTTLRSFRIDATSGQISPLGSSIPRIVAAGTGFFVAARQDPFPSLTVYSW